jgi:hypothetical protein
MRCTLLTSIPELPNLTALRCRGCTLLVSIPLPPNDPNSEAQECPWIPHNSNPNFESNIQKLQVVQRFTKKAMFRRKLMLFSRLKKLTFGNGKYIPVDVITHILAF